jgi:uncharacterized protein (TIGR00730 family)
MKSVAVFCGSSSGSSEIYMNEAIRLGETLAEKKIDLIYGGAKVGLMGAVADGALRKGGRVVGVLPRFLQSKEIAHDGLTELIPVESMHERKKQMNDLSDGVIAMPGGFGTLEEFFEMLTWGQLGLHSKPMGLLNTRGFYNHLGAQIQTMVDEGFLKELNQKMLLMSDNINHLIDQMTYYTPPPVGKWISKETV